MDGILETREKKEKTNGDGNDWHSITTLINHHKKVFMLFF